MWSANELLANGLYGFSVQKPHKKIKTAAFYRKQAMSATFQKIQYLFVTFLFAAEVFLKGKNKGNLLGLKKKLMSIQFICAIRLADKDTQII